MEIFKGLQPELVWSYFEEICKIPRPSKKEEKIAVPAEYCMGSVRSVAVADLHLEHLTNPMK